MVLINQDLENFLIEVFSDRIVYGEFLPKNRFIYVTLMQKAVLLNQSWINNLIRKKCKDNLKTFKQALFQLVS